MSRPKSKGQVPPLIQSVASFVGSGSGGGGDSANSGPFGTKVKLSELTSPSSSDRENRWTRPIHAHGKTPPFHQ